MLGAAAERDGTVLDLYNTRLRPAKVSLHGAAVEGRTSVLADMLGRPLSPCKGGAVALDARAFAKIVIGR